MHYPDLSHECQVDRGPYVRAVGWLSRDQEFPTATTSQEFLEALRRHLREPWQPVTAGGTHRCEFCPPLRNGCYIGGSRNIWISGDGVVYVAPELVLHYIEVHGYRPPDAFITAVIDCPEQSSAQYLARMREFPAWWAEELSDANQKH